MTIRVGCASCGAILKAEDRHAGRTVPCPKCQSPITLQVEPASSEPIDPFAEEAEALLSPPPPPPPRTPKPKAAKSPSPPKQSPAPDEGRESATPPPIPDDSFVEEASAAPTEEGLDDSFPNLTEEELAGQAISPRKKKRKRPVEDLDTEKPDPQFRRIRRGLAEVPTSGWRLHLHWLLLLALLPLGISVVLGDGPTTKERFEESLRNHPEVNDGAWETAGTLHDLAMLFPDHRLDGAFLPADTYMHWVFALISAGAFLAMFLTMWPGKESRSGPLLASGLTTGTIGIMLLLGFQWVAFGTGGLPLRGRGIAFLIILIVKFIAFSYICALQPDNGFPISFFGFTFGVGLCEELCKALPVAFYVSGSPKRDFRTVCLIGLASGVGFGVSEGITYSSDYYNGLTDGWIYLIRFASCVSLHAIWAGTVALLIYRDDQYLDWSWEAAFWFMIKYLLVAMLLHGLYDTLLKKDHEVLAFVTAIGSFLWFHWLLSSTAAEE